MSALGIYFETLRLSAMPSIFQMVAVVAQRGFPDPWLA